MNQWAHAEHSVSENREVDRGWIVERVPIGVNPAREQMGQRVTRVKRSAWSCSGSDVIVRRCPDRPVAPCAEA
jgi:hypothetical protein